MQRDHTSGHPFVVEHQSQPQAMWLYLDLGTQSGGDCRCRVQEISKIEFRCAKIL